MRRVTLLAALAATLPTIAMAASSSAVPVEGMPQLAFGHPEQGRLLIGQVVWLLLIFAALYFLMAKIALPRVGAVIENRHARIAADLEAAQAAKAEADGAMAAHRAATEAARGEARAAVASAVQAAQADSDAKAAALNARLNAQIAEAEARIEAARASAMGAIRGVATDTAEALVAKLVGRADRAAIDTAVGAALTAQGRA
ncbi:F0F1 ATP synthase subunit B family protein [Neoroseomonas oryzicola]|uniref:ATP synthase subunit b n=1 Tax=Neoroseomonas oryzicola TaxID=535904 RepID=A0A9X9WL25_9PROT|nr:F0F1 ATP synthase subunit B' [Neoroseomonas oryzicola]MBR0661035.1 F0F1 ATP synthase subunit B' [Neoroseomonas oryzicola]NKE18316.1 F0F1 ATP synthase subunit B' [Neoroseomonas oryzicola]